MFLLKDYLDQTASNFTELANSGHLVSTLVLLLEAVAFSAFCIQSILVVLDLNSSISPIFLFYAWVVLAVIDNLLWIAESK